MIEGHWRRTLDRFGHATAHALALVALVCLALSVATLLPVSASAAATGQIAGSVTAATGGGPIEGIYVCAKPADEEGSNSCASTNAGGEYIVEDLPSGSYRVSFSGGESCPLSGCIAPNYISQYYQGESTFADSTPVLVSAANTTSGIDAVMVTGGRITGTVTSAADGSAIEGLRVCPAPLAAEPFVACALTHAGGEYELVGLASGSYDVEFSGANDFCNGRSCVELNYVTQFYEDTATAQAGTPVVVTQPAVRSGIDASMVESLERPLAEQANITKRHEEEAATAKKYEEEAARMGRSLQAAAFAKLHEEQAAAARLRAEQAHAGESIEIERVTASARSVVVTIRTSPRGAVTLSGPGLRTLVTALSAGTHKIKVALTKIGRADRRRHRRVKLAVTLDPGGRTVSSVREVRL